MDSFELNKILGAVLATCLVLLVSSFTASYGAKLAHALPKRWLEIGFGIFLLVASVRFTLAILGH